MMPVKQKEDKYSTVVTNTKKKISPVVWLLSLVGECGVLGVQIVFAQVRNLFRTPKK